jgi:sterol desaturase/sphingolipid hydroxylase (fatty acid hydroxylase superfamily)
MFSMGESIQQCGRREEVGMTPIEFPHGTPESLRRRRKIKKLNALTAILCGGLGAASLWAVFPSTLERLAVGFLAGLVWANGFEYVYHRFLLHLPGGFLARRHLEHHRATGTQEEVEHLTFGESPLWIVMLFLVNGFPALAFDRIFGLDIAPGMFLAFSAYFVAVEEIHWRIHMGEWLPGFLEPARDYHLAHHDRPDGRYSVFFPLFDWLLGTSHSPALAADHRPSPLR